MEKEYTIGEISKLMGLSVHTIRFYEKVGLIKTVQRNDSGYRSFTEKDIAWLKFINKLRTTGMPIKEMVKFAVLHRQGNSTIPTRREMLAKHREMILLKIEELSTNLQAIEEKIQFYFRKEEELGLSSSETKAVNQG